MDTATSMREHRSRKQTQYYPSQNDSLHTMPQSGQGYEPDLPMHFTSAQQRLVLPDFVEIASRAFAEKAKTPSSALTLEKLLAVLPTGVLTLDNQGRVVDANPSAQKLLGSGLEGEYWRDVIQANFDPRVDDGHEVSLISGKRVSLMTRSLDDGNGQLIVITDLTETRELQTQLSRHQRLSAMGQMMSSLAHQIRTPLSAALLHADNLIGRHAGNQQVSGSGQKIIARLHNIERQISDMLIFAKGGVAPVQHTDVESLQRMFTEAAADLCQSYDSDIEWSYCTAQETVHCNIDALVGAFLNLLENAMQASPSFSKVFVEISAQTADTQYSDHSLLIKVIDNGSGIDASKLNNKDQSYQSTKLNGNGLGLEIVKLVCKSHGGDFKFAAVEKGACAEMRIRLDTLRGQR